jgi:SAM-dependent methyltransferase
MAPPIKYIHGDFLTHPFPPGSFDFIVCVAALHHMEADAALRKMAELLAPGGVLAVLGLARSSYPQAVPRDLVAAAVNRGMRIPHGWWESPAPQRPPTHAYDEIQRLSRRVLPGAVVRRHLLWRQSILWMSPPEPPPASPNQPVS